MCLFRRYISFLFISVLMIRRPPRSTRTDTLFPYTTLFRSQSNLVGTRLTLPEPPDKPAAAALPTTVETTLPLGAGDIEVAFGKRLALRARSAGERTGVRVVLRSDERRVGTACVSTVRSRWEPYH